MLKIKTYFSFLISHLSSRKGFTLIELLVVMVVLSAIGLVVGSIIISSLRGSTKSNTISVVRQNGSFAISQMTKMIRNAKSFEGMSTTGEEISFSTQCYAPVGGTTPTPTPVTYKHIRIIGFDNGQTTFSCTDTSPKTIASKSAAMVNAVSLLDTASVVLASCSFTCSKASYTEPPVIGIKFTLKKGEEQTLLENQAEIPFETSILMRNVHR